LPKKNPLGDELRKGEMHLPCVLTAEELLDRTDRLVKLTQDRTELEISLDHWKADKKEEQKAKDGEIRSIASRLSGLAKVIKDKKENRGVKVTFYIKDSQVTAIRDDTGEKVGEPRAASQAELQMALPGQEKKDAGA
jgi:hypothetical protein